MNAERFGSVVAVRRLVRKRVVGADEVTRYYACSLCRRKVSRNDLLCPKCGADLEADPHEEEAR